MQCTTDLGKLRDAVAARAIYLRRLASSITAPLEPDGRRTLAYVVIELDNLIVTGLRQYTKSSLLRSRTATGSRISSSIRPNSTEEAAAYIFLSLNPSGYFKRHSPTTIRERDEIAFRDPKQTEKVFLDYAASNLPNLALALSLNANVFSEVKYFRHFFAHRAKNTFEEIERIANGLGLGSASIPELLLLRGRPGTGVKILDGWLAEVKNFFDLAT